MKPLSKSRRRFLISLGLLGFTGIFYRPVYRYLEVRGQTQEWADKWHKSSDTEDAASKTLPPENGNRVPTLIEKDLTLSKAGSPWVIDKDVMVQEGVTLTIEAGSEVFFGKENYITVNGRILARGDSKNPISLRAYSNAGKDRWAGILLIQTSAPSVFQYVEFENSYYGFRLVHAAGTWVSCAFRNVRDACSGFKSEMVFKNCLIDYKNYTGSGNINVLKFYKGTAHVEGCTIYNPNSDFKVDGIDADKLVKGVFRGNRLYGGICPGADAIDIGVGSHNILIENNIITDFVDKGVSVGEGAEVVINNNIIVRCAMGIGVKDSAHAKVTNTTFYGNDYAVKCYEKVSGEGGGHAEVNNCIIASSRKAPFEIDKKSSINFTNTLCDQQLLPGKGNLQAAAKFEDIEKDQFNCISITHSGSTIKGCSLSGVSLGANIAPVSNKLSKKLHV